MRPTHLARLDKTRSVLVLTPQVARPRLRWVSVAPVTGSVRDPSTEVLVGPGNGLEQERAVSLDNVQTVTVDRLLQQICWLPPQQEAELARAL